jgi:multidrug transporter EmrE-like cation transporter
MPILFLSISITVNIIANIMFRSASTIPTYTPHKILLIAGGIAIGAINALCYAKALEKIELGTAFAVFSGASIVLIAISSYFVFKDAMPVLKIAGMAIIITGIVIVAKT